uniref:Uncharacterized protein n=1 Tax=Sipha flava TaxID=143950 RepID=A0A2S2QIT6_9HEMI
MSRISREDVMVYLNNSAKPRFRTEYWRAQPQEHRYTVVVQRTGMKSNSERTSEIDVLTAGTRTLRFTDGTRSRIFADNIKPKIWTDGTRPPRSFADGSIQWINVNGNPLYKIKQKDVATGDIVVAGTKPNPVGGQQYVKGDAEIDKEKFKVLRKDDFQHKYWLKYRITDLPSWPKLNKRVEDRTEYLRRKLNSSAIRKFIPSNYCMSSSAAKSETDEEFIIVDRDLVSNIVKEDMDGVIFDWLHLLGLDQYFWFFKRLSYNEIKYVSEDNFYMFLEKMNKSRECVDKQEVARICNVTKKIERATNETPTYDKND